MEGVIQRKTSPKDVFLHLLAIITLYGAAGSFVALLFQYVNIFSPDQLQDPYAVTAVYSTIRWAIASLVVLFPVYVMTSWFLQKEYAAQPSKRDLRIRKWLIYFTLFAAGLIMMGDLVSLIYWFLSGDLTVRFVLKVLVILFVSGAVFGYYFWDVRTHHTE